MKKHLHLKQGMSGKTWYLALSVLIINLCIWASILNVHAETPLLSAEDAFPFTVESTTEHTAQLHWNIPEQYYLYQHKFEVQQAGQPLKLELPPAHDLYDENYGHTQVYYQQVQFDLDTQASQTYKVTWQGCAKDRICYPPQSIEFKTDVNGLVSLQDQAGRSKRLLDFSRAVESAI